MKVKESEYLKSKKPILKKLLDKLLTKYEYASILANDSKSTNYSVSKTGTNISEDGTLSERGFCVKVYDNGKAAEYSFSAIEEDTVDVIFEEITERLDTLGETLPDGVTAFGFNGVEDEKLYINESTEYEVDPEEKGDNNIIDLLTRISEKGLAYDEKIIDCYVAFSYQKYSKMFLSKNKDLTQNVMWSCGY
ncbi:MAG: hypothetical protein K5678_06100, partial [Acetatifactor sp.]|nr:hypothetical protein [Acetatifactor sp.]